jgi:hypothetical protein
VQGRAGPGDSVEKMVSSRGPVRSCRVHRATGWLNCPWRQNRRSPTINGMDEPPELQHNGHWRMAVWSLRVGYLALGLAIAGLIVLSSGSTPWVLAAGVIIWLAAAAVTLTGFFWARKELPEPRPGYWSMRFMLIHDTVHNVSPGQRS